MNEHTGRFGIKYVHQNAYHVSLKININFFVNFGCLKEKDIWSENQCSFIFMLYLAMFKTSESEDVLG